MNAILSLWLVALLGLTAIHTRAATAHDGLPAGLEQRVPLTTSRVVGSPEPPLPYRAQRAFPKLDFNKPLYLAREAGSDRYLVVEQAGRTLAVPDDPDASRTEVFHNIPDHDVYSLCFHPGFVTNRFVLFFANGPNTRQTNAFGVVLGGTNKFNRILRYTVTDAGRCDPKSEFEIIRWWSNGHNGGEMAFGRDGLLYITSGDGTTDSDRNNTGQDISDLNSGLLRIDIERPEAGRGYSVPRDNPFLDLPDAKPELWAYGFRNPWRLCFDPADGGLLVGDIGQDLWEMIQLVKRGGNYGWSVREGNHPFHALRTPGPHPILPPLQEHHHAEARSITGGVVYQGTKFPELRGAYIYGDYGTGKIWGLRRKGDKVTWLRELADTPHAMLGFCEGHRGEIFYVDYAGQLYELEPAPPRARKPDFPRTLSASGLFASVKGLVPQPALLPYSVNAPLWSDGAHKERFLALPGTSRIDFHETGAWKFPEGTVLVKSFALDLQAGDPRSRRWVETRFLLLEQNEWVGYSYRWNHEQDEAYLVAPGGDDRAYQIRDPAAPGGKRTQVWHYPSRAECLTCHSRAATFVLGLNTLQMNRDHDYAGLRANQLRTLEHLGVFAVKSGPKTLARLPQPPEKMPRLPDPYDATADLTLRARAYLHSNCAQCHTDAGGGNAAMELTWRTPPDKLQLIDAIPIHDNYGIANARLVAPGAPERSVLLERLRRTGPGGMPPLSHALVDEPALQMFTEWIKGMK